MGNFKVSETDIQHLVISSLEGSASEEELLVLQKWLEESEQHFLLYQAYRQDWIQAGCLQRYPTKEAWNKVECHLFHRIPGKRLLLWTRIAGYVALAVLMIAVACVVRVHFQDENLVAVMEEQIEPGGKKAILVLSSNEEVALENESGDTLFRGDSPVKKEGDTLVYKEGYIQESIEEYNRLITPRGGEYSVILADGTKVWLNAESELKYPVQFSGNERKVFLKGEAYFSVSKREKQPFIVYLDKTKVLVLGTEFNVRNYREEPLATTLVRGTVKVMHENGKERRLLPGQQAIVQKNDIEVREVEPMYYTAWKNGYFMYNDKTLDEILKELSRWYDFIYFYQSGDLGSQTLTAKLRKFDSVERIFEILSETGHFKFLTKGKTVTVMAK